MLARGLGTPVRATTREERLGVHEGVHAAEERVVVVVVHELALEGDPEVQDTQVLQPLLRLVVHRGEILVRVERRCVRASMGPIRPLSSASSASVRCTMDDAVRRAVRLGEDAPQTRRARPSSPGRG